ncbi:MAG: FAD-dependent monooxygenase [Gammaproteobacteria bacterium]
MSANHYDIIIVGGGLVGMILGQALRDHGLHLALVDAKPLPTQSLSGDGRSLALSYSSQQILTTLDLWPALAEYATPMQTIHVSKKGVFAKTRLHASALHLPALGYVVPANILANQVAKNVSTIPELTVYAPSTVQKLEIKNKNAQLNILQSGQTQTLSARLIIAADGSQSTIAQQLHIHQEQHVYDQTAIVSTISMSIVNDNQAYERFTDQGVIALLPVRQKEFGVVWSTSIEHAQQLLALSSEEYLAELQKNMGQYWGTEVKLGERSSYPLTASYSYEQIRPRVVILGNAAHTMHPVAAQGLNLALRSVAWLAETLLETSDDIGELSVLRNYLQHVQSDQQRVQGVTHGLAEITSHISSKPLWNLGLGLFDKFPGVKKIFMRQAAGLSGKQAKLARGVKI